MSRELIETVAKRALCQDLVLGQNLGICRHPKNMPIAWCDFSFK